MERIWGEYGRDMEHEKTAKTPRRYLTGTCVFPSQRHLRHLQNQPPAHEGGLSWVDERNSSTIPASRSMKSRRLRAAFSRTSSLSMRVKKDNESSQNGSGSGISKTIKTAAATRLPDDSKARNNGSGYHYSQYAERDGVLPSLSAYPTGSMRSSSSARSYIFRATPFSTAVQSMEYILPSVYLNSTHPESMLYAQLTNFFMTTHSCLNLTFSFLGLLVWRWGA